MGDATRDINGRHLCKFMLGIGRQFASLAVQVGGVAAEAALEACARRDIREEGVQPRRVRGRAGLGGRASGAGRASKTGRAFWTGLGADGQAVPVADEDPLLGGHHVGRGTVLDGDAGDDLALLEQPLPQVERQDIWDRLVDGTKHPGLTPAEQTRNLVRPSELYICPDLLRLAQLFPVLLPLTLTSSPGRGPAALGSEGVSDGLMEARQVRQRAFGALRELLGRLGAVRPGRPPGDGALRLRGAHRVHGEVGGAGGDAAASRPRYASDIGLSSHAE